MQVVKVTQGTPEWHEFRRQGIGGSEAPAVAGESPYLTPRGLYLVKRGEVKENDEANEFIFAKGHKTEALIRKNFQELTGAEMAPVCGIHDKFSHIRCSFDGLDLAKYGPLEAKLVGKGVLEDARDEGIIPRHHWIQLQHEMEVSETDLGQWYGHDGKANGILIEVKRDAKFIREQLEREHEFWGMVREGKLPPLTPKDELTPADLRLLQEIYEAKVQADNAKAYLESLTARLDEYGHPRLRGAGLIAYKGNRQGKLDLKRIPGVKSLLNSYTERYIEKHRAAPSKDFWTVRMEKEQTEGSNE